MEVNFFIINRSIRLNILESYSFIIFFPRFIIKVYVYRGILRTFIDDRINVFFSYFLQHSSFFLYESLIDITALDFISKITRFQVVYNYLSFFLNKRLLIYTGLVFMRTFFFTRGLSTLTGLYASASWLEREVWDMYGIWFHGHYDLRRILTDYGFKGFPLRKDYPLSGFYELRYDDIKRIIIKEKIHFLQEFRGFNFLGAWTRV